MSIKGAAFELDGNPSALASTALLYSLLLPALLPSSTMQSFVFVLALVASSMAYVLPRQSATLTCGTANLQCCNTLALASEPLIANALGLENLQIPGPDITVGLNCTTPPDDGTPVTAQCIGILSCCTSINIGVNSDISEDCTMTGIGTKRDVAYEML
ncbi:hypothetical protein DACRYDRAFT_22095 [Dacryopinax primogenitus]|uniref:Hydrophobin n=1 Tax=Dacryopinax primogenitus (strain DJM 731) TaxID=1858805 RepID=M5FWV6_DACPD|nr:uncharacterized protein DACRYDRAFT_22095 [Dacryopinax primogenitus]EJU02461.1 hypothetical protein DACRYDRAFT_22095 [Dacryopinax primogenitus]